ncbi:complex I NDUFA9 subunit family protein [Sphingomonas turrisvirgatae]|uniref:3-beta hydroxysteroid dehydrogenase n=1 Tax=Sphingomonas turrisvirgatae TaxID=1888892 RepID=A0A1E3LVQ0_9SPHN|nr:complex I NDUFA9 subunit family protein [Sphingomonas turrisvirgatae]ODP37205.1 3-beta hydroxysteroid dehydrogenase [Sphingomonas turrisvirgatae]
MKDRLVTVIGGGGFAGRYVAQALLKAGARIRIAQRDPRGAFFIKPLGGLGQTQFIAADVRRPDTLARAVAGADAVVNLAGVFGPTIQAVNADGAGNVARAAAAAGVTALAHVSAIGADPDSPSAYGRSKGEGEAQVRAVFPDATILRPSLIFGQEDQFVNRFAGIAARSPFVPVLKGGTRIQPVFVADVADAIVAALDKPQAHAGQTIELGGPDVMTFTQFNQWLVQAIGKDKPVVELPDFVGAGLARFGFLPGAPITWDQWLMLQKDNVAKGDGLRDLGITPTPLGAVAAAWLVRYRKHGRFARSRHAA